MKEKTKVIYLILTAAVLAALFQTGCTRKTEMADGIYLAEGRDILQSESAETAESAMAGEKSTDAGQELSDREDADAEQTSPDRENADAGQMPSVEYYYVHICGEVRQPGVYRLEKGSRIFEAVELAKGLLPSAAEDAVNQAEQITDGMKIRIPSKEEVKEVQKDGKDSSMLWVEKEAAGKAEPEAAETGSGLININTAAEAELCTLNGIGASRAQSIIRYRNEHGRFQKIEDIMKVEGIKSGAFAKIRDFIAVE